MILKASARCTGEAVEAGFTNINVDIMSGLPGQTLASYRDTLEKVLHLEPMPQHISAYSPDRGGGTPFAAMAEGRIALAGGRDGACHV